MSAIFFMIALIALVGSLLLFLFMRERLGNRLQAERVALARAKNRIIPQIMDMRAECDALGMTIASLRDRISKAESLQREAALASQSMPARPREPELFY